MPNPQFEPADLGDGITASEWHGSIRLATERLSGEHFIYLDPPTLDALIQYAIKIGWLQKGQVL